MRKSVGMALVCAVILLGFFSVDYILDPPGIIGKVQGQKNASSFLAHLMAGEEEKAFDYLYYFDGIIDEEVKISYEDAKAIWVERVKNERSQGTYIMDYHDLTITSHDGWVNGRAKITVMNNGKPAIHDVSIHFQPVDGTWKVVGLQSWRNITEDREAQDERWEGVIHGHVPNQ
ncbi:hypothetical protein [Brevibacillus migulae]|uniref:hypothetical protein n=1 Tax=Brevibacillus migulae TaxID=1644114 RepID=UPI00106EAC0A|nr:hypothetical protein [Brevibacillus migulae]